jgi:hypothetical protein
MTTTTTTSTTTTTTTTKDDKVLHCQIVSLYIRVMLSLIDSFSSSSFFSTYSTLTLFYLLLLLLTKRKQASTQSTITVYRNRRRRRLNWIKSNQILILIPATRCFTIEIQITNISQHQHITAHYISQHITLQHRRKQRKPRQTKTTLLERYLNVTYPPSLSRHEETTTLNLIILINHE